MRERMQHALSIVRALTKETFVWCTGVLVGTMLLCMSFFTDQPVGREMTISSKIIQAAENATAPDTNQTVIVNSVTNDILQLETKEASDEYGVEAIFEEESLLPEDSVFVEDDERIINDYSGFDDYSLASLNVVSLSSERIITLEEFEDLCKIVESEASTQDLIGRTLVADVILNRVDSPKYANNIRDVILSKGQFEPVTRGSFYISEPDSLSKEAVINALNGDNNAQGAIYFQKSPDKVWGDKQYLFRYGDHSFYK